MSMLNIEIILVLLDVPNNFYYKELKYNFKK